MGKVIAKIKLTNIFDLSAAEEGYIPVENVRSITTDGLVDTGANYLSLPEETAEKLGLKTVKEVTVKYGDGHKDKKKIAKGLNIEFLEYGRDADIMCIVESSGTQILIGQIPLEYVDLSVNCSKGTLEVNPESPDIPLIEML